MMQPLAAKLAGRQEGGQGAPNNAASGALGPKAALPQNAHAIPRPILARLETQASVPTEVVALHEKLRMSDKSSGNAVEEIKAENAAVSADVCSSKGAALGRSAEATPEGVKPTRDPKGGAANLALATLKEDLARRRLFDESSANVVSTVRAPAMEPQPLSTYCANDVDELLSELGVQGRFVVIRHSPNKPLGLQLSFDPKTFPNAVRITGVKGAAADAGDLRVNDAILEINGQSMMDATHSLVVETLRGMRGRDVGLLVVDSDEISAAYLPYLDGEEDGDIARGNQTGAPVTPPAPPEFAAEASAPRLAGAETPPPDLHGYSALQLEAGDELAEERARLQELEVQNALLSAERTRLLALEEQNAQLASNLKDAKQRAEAFAIEASQKNEDSTRAEVDHLKSKLGKEAAAAQARMRELQSANNTLNADLARTQEKAKAAAGLDAEMDKLRAELAASQEKLGSIETQRVEDEMLRRKLHHVIQELKGNIRVYCRIRPFAREEAPESLENRAIHPSVSKERITIQESAASKAHNFNFDNVFTEESTQADVFEEVIPILQSAIDGYNVCIFAYGQTGAGKTHTMQGGSGDQCGIIPRTVEHLFRLTGNMESKGWSYSVQTSFLEIYNETLRDLLSTSDHEKLEIFHDPETNETIVSNLEYHDVSSADEVFHQLAAAGRKRATSSTLMNAQSSRSHSIFRVRLVGRNAISGDSCASTLNLVDLAGSERLSSVGGHRAVGQGIGAEFDSRMLTAAERLRETQCINKSLSALSNVMSSLQKKTDHVPFRDSKLTHLLQDSLGGNSKSIMIVNVAPVAKSAGETLCSLRFAATVGQVELGKAKRQTAPKAGGSRRRQLPQPGDRNKSRSARASGARP